MLSSLSNRIFLASALLAVLSIGTALYLVNVVVTRQAEAELEESLLEAGELVTQFQSLFFTALLRDARIVADVPQLKAAVDTNHAGTVAPLLTGYLEAVQADLLVVTNRAGDVLGVLGDSGVPPKAFAGQRIVKAALAGRRAVDVWSQGSGLLQVVSVPISIDTAQPEVLGTLTAGLRLDRPLADRIKSITRSDVVFVDGGKPRGSTLPADVTAALLAVPDDGRILRATVHGEEYEAVRRRLVLDTPGTLRSASASPPAGPLAIVARSRTAHLAFLRNLHSALGATTAVAVLVATLLSFAVARTVTRPIAPSRRRCARWRPPADLDAGGADADAVGRRGRAAPDRHLPFADPLARSLPARGGAARTAVVPRPAVDGDRARNPQPADDHQGARCDRCGAASRPEEVAGVAADIEGEVTRLNRVVNDVLDYAKPIALTYDAGGDRSRWSATPRRRSWRARRGRPTWSRSGRRRHRDDRRRSPPPGRDQPRDQRPRRRAGARGGVAPASADDAGAPIRVRRRCTCGRACSTTPTSRSPSPIAASACPTSRWRGCSSRSSPPSARGSGIGLAIAKNIVDGLGGRIDVDSQPGAGTTIRLTLPAIAAGADRPIERLGRQVTLTLRYPAIPAPCSSSTTRRRSVSRWPRRCARKATTSSPPTAPAPPGSCSARASSTCCWSTTRCPR